MAIKVLFYIDVNREKCKFNQDSWYTAHPLYLNNANVVHFSCLPLEVAWIIFLAMLLTLTENCFR